MLCFIKQHTLLHNLRRSIKSSHVHTLCDLSDEILNVQFNFNKKIWIKSTDIGAFTQVKIVAIYALWCVKFWPENLVVLIL